MFGKFMNKKFFHPTSYPNQKQKWIHERRRDANKKNEEEKQATYQKEQESYQSRLLSAKSTGEKLKLDLNFMYDAPPGMRKDSGGGNDEENEEEEVFRHLNEGNGHKIALSLELGKPANERMSGVTSSSSSLLPQRNVADIFSTSSKEAYIKLTRTAYELAMNPTLPLRQFKTLVKVQRVNGVRLVQGHQDSKAAREFIHYISEAVQEKCAAILARANFMSLLSDGSTARKTRSEKELVLIRTERAGVPVYIVATLLEMSEWGGTDAESLKKGIDSIFAKDGKYEMEVSDYESKLVSATADGASVNFGRYTGLLTRMAANRPWLLKIHCVNHRVELSLKDAVKKSAFGDVDTFYISLHSFLKNSGKTKSEIKTAAEALNIKHFTLPKLTGTRFVGHRRKVYTTLLKMWPAVTTALENVESDTKTKTETRAKLKGFLRNYFHSYHFLCIVCVYLDILEIITPVSKVFESELLAISSIKPAIDETLSSIEEEISVCGTDDEILTSHLASFKLGEGDVITSSFVRGDDKHKRNIDRESINVTLSDMTYNTEQREQASAKKKALLIDLKEFFKSRFADFFENELLENTKWFDPKNWSNNNRTYGINQISFVAKHFDGPLQKAGFNLEAALREWKAFRSYVSANYRAIEAVPLWEKIFQYRRKEYSNLCKLAEILLCLSGSNSTVERAFSLLTNMLSDRRLLLSHKTINDIMAININDKLWTDIEREEIIVRAAELFEKSKRRVRREEGPPAKAPRLAEVVISDEEEDESSDSSENEDSSDCSDVEDI